MKASKQDKKETKQKSALSQFVVIIGDEGAILVQIQKGKVINRIFTASPDETTIKNFDKALLASPNSPITILFDFMDQSYVRQSLPPVSSLSVGKIIERRLNKDFAPDDIKGYIVLGRETAGRKDWNYLMVAVPNNQIIQKWIAFFIERTNPFKGIGLIPLEAQGFIKAIDNAFLKKKEKGAKPLEWHVLVSHNKVGGFRQVVTRNGKMIFTRMAQSVGETSPEVIAGNIEQEISNILEYMKRLGLQDPNLISVTILCSEEIKKAISPGNINAGESNVFTPFEIAELLGMKDVAKAEDQFGDVILCAFYAKTKKLILKLNTPYTKKIIALYTNIHYLKLGGAIALVGILSWMGFVGYTILNDKSELGEMESKHAIYAADLEKVKKLTTISTTESDFHVDVMSTVELLIKPQYDIIAFIQKLGKVPQDAAVVTKIEWVLSDPMKVTTTADTRQFNSEVEFKITLPKEPRSAFAEGSKALAARLVKEFSDDTVTYPEIPGVVSESTEIKASITDDGKIKYGDEDAKNAQDVLKATISGPKKK